MDTAVCLLKPRCETKASDAEADGIRRADGKWRMLDNHDEISPERRPRDTQTVLGTNGQVFPKIPRFSRNGDCQRNGSVDFAGWHYRVPPKMSLILFR